MDFRLELHIKPWKQKLAIQDKVMLMGSCFTEHMSARFEKFRFRVMENPHGILFNPVSIVKALEDYIHLNHYEQADLLYSGGLWQSWNHHGRFASVEAALALKAINNQIDSAGEFLRNADWLIITLGSAFVYELLAETDMNPTHPSQVVANCHKVPAQYFNHRLLSIHEVSDALQRMVTMVRAVNPGIKFIFTISPVRHSREGLVENNRSKGLLHNAVGDMLSQEDHIYYFPAYELIIDDLRDYRFYAEDMVHPNYLATRYVWDKFAEASIDEESRIWMERINRVQAAMHHRPRQPDSEQHKDFLKKMYNETLTLSKEMPFLQWEDALSFFSAG